MLPLKIKDVQAFCTEMNCTPEEPSPRSLWKSLLSPGVQELGRERHRALWVLCAPPGCSFTAAAARAEPHPQWGRRNNGGCSSGSEAQPAEPVQSSPRCPGVELSLCAVGTWGQPRGWCCMQQRARGVHSGDPRGSQGSPSFTP